MRFLFICHQYPPDTDASSNIVRHLAEELINQKNIVDVITQGDVASKVVQHDVNIYRVKKSWWEIINKKWKNGNAICKCSLFFATYIRKIVCAIRIKSYPNVEPVITRRMLQVFEKNLVENRYDCVIAFFRPYFCLETALRICKGYGIRFVPVYFDLIEEKDCPRFMPLNLFWNKIKCGDSTIFQNSYKVFLPYSAKDSGYVVFQDNVQKIEYYNFPTFIKNEDVKTEIMPLQNENEKIVFVFAGTLTMSFRNPIKLLEILNEMAKLQRKVCFELHIYGGGDCQQFINGFNHEKNFTIIQHGYVSKEVANNALLAADCLINITNEYSAIVPSKIFELFAIGKPILNIVNNGDDGSLTLFEKYPLKYNVQYSDYDEMRKSMKETYTFIQKNLGKEVSYESLIDQYYECTPQFMVSQIIKILEEK